MTTFKNIDNDKYGFYCGRKSVASDEIIDDNVYTVILKDKGLETYMYISDYNSAAKWINRHLDAD